MKKRIMSISLHFDAFQTIQKTRHGSFQYNSIETILTLGSCQTGVQQMRTAIFGNYPDMAVLFARVKIYVEMNFSK